MRSRKKVILFGFGSFGQHLYKYLHQAGHSIKVISRLEENTQLGKRRKIDIQTVDFKNNEEILSLGINPKQHLLYCAMNRTANNLFLVLTLRTLFPESKIIAISNSSENARKLTYAGANSVIDLYESTAKRITNSLSKPAVTRALDEIIYHRSDIKMAEVEIPIKSPLDGKYLSKINLKGKGLILLAIIDKEFDNKLIIIDKRIDHKLDSGDILVLVGKEDDINRFKEEI